MVLLIYYFSALNYPKVIILAYLETDHKIFIFGCIVPKQALNLRWRYCCKISYKSTIVRKGGKMLNVHTLLTALISFLVNKVESNLERPKFWLSKKYMKFKLQYL